MKDAGFRLLTRLQSFVSHKTIDHEFIFEISRFVKAFSRLHDVVPNELDYDSSPCYDEDNKSKRVSKVTTLKRAINYIKLLQRALSIDHQ